MNQCLKCGRRVGWKIPYHQLSREQIKNARLWNPKLRARGSPTARRKRYQAYLHSATWRRLRERILIRDGFICMVCGEEAGEVHHLSYERFGHELDTDLIAICRDCNLDKRGR